MATMTLRLRITTELAVLAVLTALFLVVFPHRNVRVDAGLALFALGLIAWNAPFTRREIWSRFPAAEDRPARRAYTLTLSVTAAVVAANLGLGIALAHRSGGWEEVAERFSNPGILVVMAVYFLWALLQQTLFQFYLLGRLRVVFATPSPWPAVVVTGLAYSLVHLPDLRITAVTAVMGVFWTWVYERYRRLVPLAISHAILGATFYYWVYGRDLAASWYG